MADSKKDAEEEVNRETTVATSSNSGQGVLKESEREVPGKRQRKRKSYGKEFESEDSDEGLDITDAKEDGIYIYIYFFH